jgi:hypothetical protein
VLCGSFRKKSRIAMAISSTWVSSAKVRAWRCRAISHFIDTSLQRGAWPSLTTTIALAVYLFMKKKPLKRLAPSDRVNTQLKQGVNERNQSTKHIPFWKSERRNHPVADAKQLRAKWPFLIASYYKRVANSGRSYPIGGTLFFIV